MRAIGTGMTAWLLGSALLFGCMTSAANAGTAHHSRTGKGKAAIYLNPQRGTPHAVNVSWMRQSRAPRLYGRHFAARSYGISCVPYARQESGIQVAGNAWQWWYNAEGLYARGDTPEPGSVLNFRANGRMRLGHVAVVSRVVNAREVIVDHANWPGGGGRGGVSHDVAVVDVSEANNWSAVRVEMGRDGVFGSVYPTYGFIYNRPDTGFVRASQSAPAPMTEMNRSPSDLRPAAERPWHTVEEVAEAPNTPRRAIDLTVPAATLGFGR